MNKLDIINRMLGSCGELPVSSLQSGHTMLPAATARLSTVLEAVLSEGWWFNRETAKLPVQEDGKVYIPNDALSVRAPEGLVQRGRLLYDSVKGQYEFTSPVTVRLCRALLLEQLPPLAAAYVAARAVKEFQASYDGDGTTTNRLEAEATLALRKLNAEETRQARYVMGQDNPDLMALRVQMQYNRSRR